MFPDAELKVDFPGALFHDMLSGPCPLVPDISANKKVTNSMGVQVLSEVRSPLKEDKGAVSNKALPGSYLGALPPHVPAPRGAACLGGRQKMNWHQIITGKGR